MAGRGPAPKQSDRRARRNGDPVPLRVIEVEADPQPSLPTVLVEADGELVEFCWPAATVDWWRMWAESPLSAEFTAADWSFLVDTAKLHAEFWNGKSSVAPELRLRVAKFGQTPEDRLRLRIQFAAAEEAESRTQKPKGDARQRRGPLTA